MYSETFEDEKYIYIQYLCPEDGFVNNDGVQITFTSADGNRYNLTADENGKVSYAEVPAGQYDVEMFDENGKTIIWYQMQVDEEETVEPSEPVQPDEPEQPDQTTEPEQSDETETPKEDEDFFGKGEVEYPTESETETQPKKGNGGLIVGITVVLILLAAGAVTTIILIKKKNKKSKKESK